jgi:hypothetical protein
MPEVEPACRKHVTQSGHQAARNSSKIYRGIHGWIKHFVVALAPHRLMAVRFSTADDEHDPAHDQRDSRKPDGAYGLAK